MINFSDRLRLFIRAHGLTQATFAELVGITQGAVAEVLRKGGSKGFSQNTIEGLFRAFDRDSVVWLLTGEGGVVSPLIGKSRPVDRKDEALVIPFFPGGVPASPPDQVEEEWIPVRIEDPGPEMHKDCILIRVKGSSMAGAGIADGDILIVDRSRAAADGEFVVAFIEGEGTLKKLDTENQQLVAVTKGRGGKFTIPLSNRDVHLTGVVVGKLGPVPSSAVALMGSPAGLHKRLFSTHRHAPFKQRGNIDKAKAAFCVWPPNRIYFLSVRPGTPANTI